MVNDFFTPLCLKIMILLIHMYGYSRNKEIFHSFFRSNFSFYNSQRPFFFVVK